MNSDEQVYELERFDSGADGEDSTSVDDFIRQLEEKEKDLHITAETTVIELAESFDDGELPEYLQQDFKVENAAVATIKPAAPAISSSNVSKLEDEITSLKTKIVQMEEERAEIFKNSQRRARDFENFKARTERERNESFQNQVGNLATQMLPALDNLNRALDFVLAMPEEQQAGVREFIDGVVLVSQQMNDVLDDMGVHPIMAVGEIFDPNLHDAVAAEESDEYADGVVCGEVLRGYRVGDRVVRHSMVKVAKRSEPPA